MCYSHTKSFWFETEGQSRHVTTVQDGGPREIWKPNRAFLKFIISGTNAFIGKSSNKFGFETLSFVV